MNLLNFSIGLFTEADHRTLANASGTARCCLRDEPKGRGGGVIGHHAVDRGVAAMTVLRAGKKTHHGGDVAGVPVTGLCGDLLQARGEFAFVGPWRSWPWQVGQDQSRRLSGE